MFFFVMTKNLNWEISAKNLVTFKRWMGFIMKNFYMGVYWKIWFFFFLGGMGVGVVHEKTIFFGRGCSELPKKGGLDSRFKRGFDKKGKKKGLHF